MSVSAFHSELLLLETQEESVRELLRLGAQPHHDAVLLSRLRRLVAWGPEDLLCYRSDIGDERARRLQTQIDLARGLLYSPIRRLPVELLARILETCARSHRDRYTIEDEGDDIELERLRRTHLLPLAQVCALWRTVVFETPSFWSDIIVDDEYWPESMQPHLDILEVSIQRSKARPLRIICAANENAAAQPLARLAQEAHRWRTVFLCIHEASIPTLLPIRGRLRVLEHLELSTSTGIRRLPWGDIFAECPKLTELVVTGHPANIPEVLPWRQLTRLAIYRNNIHRYIDRLAVLLSDFSGALSLNSLITRIGSSAPPPPVPQTSTITALVLLLSFDVEAEAEATEAEKLDIIANIMGAFVVPELSFFALKPEPEPEARRLPPWNPQAFESLLSRSSIAGSLRRLTLVALITGEELLRALEMLPALTVLCVADPPEWHLLDEGTLEGLCRTAPQLRLTRLHYATHTSVEPSFLRMVEHHATGDDIFELGLISLPQSALAIEETTRDGLDLLVRQGLVRLETASCRSDEGDWHVWFGRDRLGVPLL
ncbi:F-box domain-containing protein [Mycena chlorophos]|uniref:F-box domain-containing protein n=1 Tax=Mycena chlorophos TaxID=658473 RepID=A0A8H6S7P2_MYCCL|nr:F-box domain-containing protein [Mycena chlorophos]